MSEVRQNKDRPSSESPGRKEWIKPDLKIISAGSAELAVGIPDDGADKS